MPVCLPEQLLHAGVKVGARANRELLHSVRQRRVRAAGEVALRAPDGREHPRGQLDVLRLARVRGTRQRDGVRARDRTGPPRRPPPSAAPGTAWRRSASRSRGRDRPRRPPGRRSRPPPPPPPRARIRRDRRGWLRRGRAGTAWGSKIAERRPGRAAHSPSPFPAADTRFSVPATPRPEDSSCEPPPRPLRCPAIASWR